MIDWSRFGMVILLLEMATVAQGQTTYRVTHIPVRNGAYSQGGNSIGVAINNAGQVAGQSDGGHAIIYSNGVTTDISPNATNNAEVGAINATGQAVGFQTTAQLANAGFLYSGGISTPIGGAGSAAFGINDQGTVVGFHQPGGQQHAFVYSNGSLTDLNAQLGASSSGALAINNAGQIAGWLSSGNGMGAFRYQSGTVTILPFPAGSLVFTGPFAMNTSGHIIGYYRPSAGSSNLVSFLFNGITLLSVPPPPGGSSPQANGINSVDQVVGHAAVGSQWHAFLYANGQTQDLNSLLDPVDKPYVTVNYGWAINDSGVIVATVTDTRCTLSAPCPGLLSLLTPSASSAATSDAPLPIWALGWLGAGLIGIGFRRLGHDFG
jgi:probable HAF family extracellular repeat protein